MESMLSNGRRSGQGWLRLAPQTKLFILFAGNIAMLLSPGLGYEVCMTGLILVFGLLCGVYRYSLTMTGVYLLLVVAQTVGTMYLDDALRIFLVTIAVFLRKILPSAILGGIFIATTRVNEFMAVMYKLRMPASLVIPLAVTLRYFPVVKEEWGHIRDAMNMRGISASWWGFLAHPLQTTECIYVPMLISAVKIADELAAAAVTRGIDNPKPRTCSQQLRFGLADGLCVFSFTLPLLGVFWK